MNFTADQQAIILKGIAQQLLQMNKPMFYHLEQMMEEMNIFSKSIIGKQYTIWDNSYIQVIGNSNGISEYIDLYKKTTTIVSEPFEAKNPYDSISTWVVVKYNDRCYVVLWYEAWVK